MTLNTTSTTTSSSYKPLFAEGPPGKGIDGYDLGSSADRIFAFDYNHSGKTDHLVLYRPGTGTVAIVKGNTDGNFTSVYTQANPGSGIGGYDLLSTADKAFAYDYDHSGNLDHIVLYRPGAMLFCILKNENGEFSAVFRNNQGIGTYNLMSPRDLAFAFDYDHSGKQDHIALYRPGIGWFYILKNENGDFRQVYPSSDNVGTGIGGFGLRFNGDRAFAFDYDHSGNLDHLVLYRPGSGIIWILRHRGDEFEPVYRESDTILKPGIGGYDLKSSTDQVFAFDNDGSGRADHLVLYRPGAGAISIVKNLNGVFNPVYTQEGNPMNGIAGYDLKAAEDLAFGFDYTSSGQSNHLTLYRPGTGTIWVLNRI